MMRSVFLLFFSLVLIHFHSVSAGRVNFFLNRESVGGVSWLSEPFTFKVGKELKAYLDFNRDYIVEVDQVYLIFGYDDLTKDFREHVRLYPALNCQSKQPSSPRARKPKQISTFVPVSIECRGTKLYPDLVKNGYASGRLLVLLSQAPRVNVEGRGPQVRGHNYGQAQAQGQGQGQGQNPQGQGHIQGQHGGYIDPEMYAYVPDILR